MKIKLLSFMLVASIVGSSCKKDKTFEEIVNTPISEISAPDGFNWSGSRDVYLSLGVSDTRFQNAIHIIKVYTANPAQGGELLSKGSATLVSPFNTRFALSSLIKQVYIEKIAKDGTVVAQNITLTSNNISVSIGAQSITQTVSAASFNRGISNMNTNFTNTNFSVATETSPSCDDPYDVELTSALTSDGQYVMQSGKVYVIKTSFSVNFWNEQPTGVTLRICASNVTVNNFKIRDNSSLIITSGATNVKINTLGWEGNGTFKNFGQTESNNGSLTVTGTFVNQGNLNLNSGNTSFTINSNSTFTNTSVFKSGNFITNSPVANSGNMEVKEFTSNSNAAVTNAGPLTVNGNCKLQSPFSNNNTITISSGLTITTNAALVNTGSITANENFKTESPLSNSGTLTFRKEGVFASGSNFTNSSTGTVSIGANSTVNGYFGNSGIVNFSKEITFQSNSSVENAASGKLKFVYNTNFEGTFDNEGEATWTTGVVQFNSGSSATNSGIIKAEDSQLISKGLFNNNSGGAVTVKTLTQNSGGSVINNHCKFIVLDNADIDQIINNYSYFKVANKVDLSGNINLINSALFHAGSVITLDGYINGSGTGTSVFKLIGNIPNDRAARITGTVDLSTNTAVNAALFVAPAKKGNTVYIATSPCMPEGHGEAPSTPADLDADDDGVNDDVDDYPLDGRKVHKNLSPNVTTLAFEDSWPLKGDYDLNDVVMTYHYEIATDKNNIVTSVTGHYKLIATGGTFKNGAGIQFNLPAGSVDGFTSTTTTPGTNAPSLENGQDSVVVILFNDSRGQQATWNTIAGETVSDVREFSFSFYITNGPTLAAFGIGNYNPFIWNNTYGRGYETHMFGKKPTNKANTALFGTGNDATGNGRYYGTAQNLPWAIELPIENFKYPIEKAPITNAYKLFSNWAISGGSQSADWYINESSSYRDASKIYTLGPK